MCALVVCEGTVFFCRLLTAQTVIIFETVFRKNIAEIMYYAMPCYSLLFLAMLRYASLMQCWMEYEQNRRTQTNGIFLLRFAFVRLSIDGLWQFKDQRKMVCALFGNAKQRSSSPRPVGRSASAIQFEMQRIVLLLFFLFRTYLYMNVLWTQPTKCTRTWTNGDGERIKQQHNMTGGTLPGSRFSGACPDQGQVHLGYFTTAVWSFSVSENKN